MASIIFKNPEMALELKTTKMSALKAKRVEVLTILHVALIRCYLEVPVSSIITIITNMYTGLLKGI